MLLFHSFHLLGVWMKNFAAFVQFNVVVADQSSNDIFYNIYRPPSASNPLKLTKTEQPTMKKKKDESRKRKSALDEIMEVSEVNRRFSKALNMDILRVVSSQFRYSTTQDR